MKPIISRIQRDDDNDWLAISDLMTGLMTLFLLVAIMYMRQSSAQSPTTVDVPTISPQEIYRQQIYEALKREFENDLSEWQAEIEPKTLIFRFNEPDVLFAQGSAELQPRFQKILENFFPRYLSVLEPFFRDSQNRDIIEEVRIEGHTSSEWNADTLPREAYINNMRLSQERTLEVVDFCLRLSGIETYFDWIQGHVTGRGMSSSRSIPTEDGREDKDASRRVEFAVHLRDDELPVKIVPDSPANGVRL